MHAGDECAAAFVFFDQVELPQGACRIEPLSRQLARKFLQGRALALAAMPLEHVANHVAPDVKVGVGHPVRAHGVVDHLLLEAVVLQELVGDALHQGVVRDGGLEKPHTDDHHQIDVVVHPQPGGVHA